MADTFKRYRPYKHHNNWWMPVCFTHKQTNESVQNLLTVTCIKNTYFKEVPNYFKVTWQHFLQRNVFTRVRSLEKIRSSVIWRCTVEQAVPDVLKEVSTFIFKGWRVQEEYTHEPLKIKALYSIRTSGNMKLAAKGHVPEDPNPQHHSGNLKSHSSVA